MKKYKQLTLGLRYQIFAYKNENYTITKIAELIEVSKSTISRELSRNSNNGYYSANDAHIKAVSRDKFKDRYKKLTNKLKLKIGKILRDSLSPGSGGRLYKLLRHKNKKYGNRSSQYKTRGQIKNRVNISKRAKIIEKKTRFGDFEVDTIIGKDHKGAIVTLVDRKSKFTLMKIVESKKADVVTQAIIELLHPIKKLVRTITSDNGKEFSYHEEIAQKLNLKFYFCDPYSSWQRGLNEHTNGLVREYIPKKYSFENINQTQITIIQNRLNNRPRKILKYYTPNEIFFKEVSRKMVA